MEYTRFDAMKHTCFVIAAMLLLGMPRSRALTPREEAHDSLINSERVLFFGQKDTKPSTERIHELMNHFYEDQFRCISEPAAPSYMFMTRNANLALGLGGALKLRSWFDWNGTLPGAAFNPYNIPLHPDRAEMRALGATTAGTMVYLRAFGHNEQLGEYQLHIEGEFYGDAAVHFLLRKAYASLNDWTIGLAPTTFSDPAALPHTVDIQGPNNKIDATAILLRWMHTWADSWVMAASVENPAPLKVTDVPQQSKLVKQWIPDLSTFLQYQWGHGHLQHIRLSLTARTMSYRNLLLQENINKVGWGVQLSSVFNPIRPLTVYATLNGGRGIASLGGDWIMNNFDMCPDPEHPGTLYAPHVLGYMVGLQYNFSPHLFASTAWGQARFSPMRNAIRPQEYKYGVYGAANLFYNITSRVQVGCGYNIGKRENFSRHYRVIHRLGLLATFAF